MIATLISLGLIATSFAFDAGDLRVIKLKVAMLFAIVLGLLVFHHGSVKGFRNKWILILMAYLPIAYILSPKPQIKLFGMEVSSFWAWQPMFIIWVFFSMLALISSYKFYTFDIRSILTTMYWCGFLTCLYVIMQFYHVDQFFYQTSGGADGRMAGFIGNPTLTAPFIAMMIPITLYLRKYWQAVIMLIAVVMTESQMAIGATAASLIAYISFKNAWFFATGLILTGVLIFVIHTGYQKGIVNDSSRFEHWPQILEDIRSPIVEDGATYPLTGIGLGSFRYTYHIKHGNNYYQAHNEYLEIAYNVGLAGLFLFIASLLSLIKPYLHIGVNRYRRALLASFLCIAMCAMGTFVWQIGTTIFATIVVAGLLMNQEEMEHA